MAMTRWIATLVVACTVGWLGVELEAQEPLTADNFDQLHALIQPLEEETQWLQIPWQTDLWQARQLAAAQDKPILLWEMDGNPLGCG